MPVRICCPKCTKELSAPDELVGQWVACPRCGNRFHIDGQTGTVPMPTRAPTSVASNMPAAQAAAHPKQPAPDNMLPPSAPASPAPSHTRSADLPPPPASGGADSTTANLERISLGSLPTPTAPSAATPVAEGALREPPQQIATHDAGNVSTKNSASSLALPAGAPPSDSQPAAKATPGGGKTARFKGPPPGEHPPAAQPMVPQPTVSPSPNSQHAAFHPTAPVKKKREVKQAKFVASGAVSTRINLGADGQLPELVVADSKTSDETKDEAESSTSPMLMLGVLIFSVVVSVVMLTLPDTSKQNASTSKQDAVALVEEHYIGLQDDQKRNQDLKPYQRLLREGLQARRRGDQDAARAAFRRVLEMLRAETSGNRGVTTEYKWAEFPPNDRDLERLLNVLLADD